MIRQRRPFVETCSAIPRGISASVGHFPALRGKRNAESICGSPPGSGAVSPPIRAKRVFWRVTVELRRNANAGVGRRGGRRRLSHKRTEAEASSRSVRLLRVPSFVGAGVWLGISFCVSAYRGAVARACAGRVGAKEFLRALGDVRAVHERGSAK